MTDKADHIAWATEAVAIFQSSAARDGICHAHYRTTDLRPRAFGGGARLALSARSSGVSDTGTRSIMPVTVRFWSRRRSRDHHQAVIRPPNVGDGSIVPC